MAQTYIDSVFETIVKQNDTASENTKSGWLDTLDICKKIVTDADILTKINFHKLLIESSLVNNGANNTGTNTSLDDRINNRDILGVEKVIEKFNNYSQLQVIAQTYFGVDEKDLSQLCDTDGLIEYYINHDYESALEIFIEKKNYMMIADMYCTGKGVKLNKQRALKYYQKVDNSLSVNNIGAVHYVNDSAEGIKYYQKAADMKLSASLVNLGNHHFKHEKNYVKAMEYYQRAANANNSTALIHIGDMHYYGRACDRNNTKAIKYYEAAAIMGNANALVELGFMYFNGYSIIKDRNKAIQYYQRATDVGNNLGLFRLGFLYRCEGNTTQEIKCFEDAAKHGHIRSCEVLGDIYKKRNEYYNAVIYYKKAIDLGGNLYIHLNCIKDMFNGKNSNTRKENLLAKLEELKNQVNNLRFIC